MWVAQSGWCEYCREPNLTVANIVLIREETRTVGICPRCAGRVPRAEADRTVGAGDSTMAGRTSTKAPAAAGSQFAGRFPGGKPLHDEGGKLNWQWTEVGQELVGEFVSIKPYENGHIAKVREVETGTMRAFSAPSVLASYLDNVEPGTQVAIVYSGEKPPKKRGQSPIKLFEVYELPEG